MLLLLGFGNPVADSVDQRPQTRNVLLDVPEDLLSFRHGRQALRRPPAKIHHQHLHEVLLVVGATIPRNPEQPVGAHQPAASAVSFGQRQRAHC